MSEKISMKQLLESGVHFGHRTNKWNPKMKPYIFTERNGIHILDLQQTVEHLETAYNFVRDNVAAGGTVLFVGTKRQAQESVQQEAMRCGMPYVVERWLPGTLTNWITIFERIKELERLEQMRDTGELKKLVKKEGLMVERKINRLLVHLSGIRYMKRIPDVLFIVDVMREATAVHEANLKNLPVVALVDTNCDPAGIDYLIPSNDDAIRAIKLLVEKTADAVLEGRSMRKEEEEIEAAAMMEGAEAVRGRIALEEDIDDEELLGAATLAKIVRTPVELDKEDLEELQEFSEKLEEETPQAEEKPVKAVKKVEEAPKAEAEPAAEEEKTEKPKAAVKKTAEAEKPKVAVKKTAEAEKPKAAAKKTTTAEEKTAEKKPAAAKKAPAAKETSAAKKTTATKKVAEEEKEADAKKKTTAKKESADSDKKKKAE